MNNPWVTVADQDTNLEDEAPEEDRDEDDQGVYRHTDRSVHFVRVQKPAHANKWRRNFAEEENNSKDDGEVHKGQCAQEGRECNDMVPNHLLVKRCECPDQEDDLKGVLYEVPASVH